MCGITGYVTHHQKADTQTLERMNKTLVRRGPDSGGIYCHHHYGIAARRLAIIDIPLGNQPISNVAGNVHVVFNGEIYNYPLLKRELEQGGAIFQTNSDTETILHAYICWGENFVEKLNGMFAIALIDEQKQKLFLYRDRVGIKPLYYQHSSSHFLFGSEIKTLLAHPECKANIREESVHTYLRYRFVPYPNTFYNSIQQVKPAGILTYDLDKRELLSERRYWSLDFTPQKLSYDETRNQLATLLNTSVSERMLSEAPLGAFLSGGIDSSTVVALMAKHSHSPVKTFSIGFQEASFDETAASRVLAKQLHTEHTEHIVVPGDILEVLHQMLLAYDQPTAGAGALPFYFVCQEASKDLRVSLSGLGADELFLGYERHLVQRYHRLLQYLPAKLLTKFFKALKVSGEKHDLIWRIKKFLSSASDSDISHFGELLTTVPLEALKDARKTSNIFCQYMDEISGGDFYNRALHCDLNTILTDDYLTFTDRISMHHSLEVRVPFLDHHVIEFAAKIPASYKLRGLTTKAILRDAAKELLPKEVLRRKKQGFESPIAQWIRGPLKNPFQHYLFEVKSQFLKQVKPGYLKGLFENHLSCREDNSRQLYALFMLAYWETELLKN